MYSMHTDTLPDMLSGYDAAKMRLEQTKPWRGLDGEHDPRPLSAHRKNARRNRHLSIRKREDGAIACRLYRTDVVAYHPNGQIELNTYQSVTTDAFANALLRGAGIYTSFNSGLGRLIRLCTYERQGDGTFLAQERIYDIGEGSLMTPSDYAIGSWIVEDPRPIRTWRRDPDEAREARAKHPLIKDFTAWYKALDALGKLPQRECVWSYNGSAPKAFAKCMLRDDEVVGLLDKGIDSWVTLARFASPSTVLDRIYEIEDVGGMYVEIPYIVGGWRTVARIRSGQIKFGGSYRMRR